VSAAIVAETAPLAEYDQQIRHQAAPQAQGWQA
jgi:hypothetical protein